VSDRIPFVIHAIPGRIRFRIYRLAHDPDYAARLESLLQSDSNITQVRINRTCASVAIRYRKDLRSIQEICTRVGELIQKGAIIPSKGRDRAIPPSEKGEWSILKLPLLATLLGIASSRGKFSFLRPLALGTLIAAAFPVAERAMKSLLVNRKLNIDCLDLLALSLSGMQGKLATPALVIALHELGDIIREKTARSTESRTANLLDAIGHLAWVERDGQPVQIPSDRVQPGETVIVYPGEQIPVDGIVWQGQAVIDQQQLTGESMPIVAKEGTYVYASTFVRSGRIRLRAERVGNQTRAAASIALLEKAPVHDTRMANYAAQIAERLILPSLGLAGIVLATTRDPARAASILTLDFVTGIRVSMPTAFLGALNHTTRHGVLVRSGRTLELLAEVNTIVFDKTGTLTQGEIAVNTVRLSSKPGRLRFVTQVY
jgi:Cu2+-exporting ATPase